MMKTSSKNFGFLLTRNLDLFIILIIFLVLPRFIPVTFAVHTLVYGVAALAVNVMYGYGGLLSFGHALLLGLGCYGTAFALNYLTDNIVLAVAVGALLTLSVGALAGIFALRRRDPYFSLVMLAFNVFFYQLWVGPLASWTGSDMGLFVKLPVTLDKSTFYHTVLIPILAILLVLTKIFLKSCIGSLLIATSENEEKVKSIGHNPYVIKYIGLLFSSFLAGLIGTQLTLYLAYVGIDYISPMTNPILVFSVLVGGAGTIIGPFIGSIIYNILNYILLVLLGWHATIYLEGIIGLFLIILMIWFRGGLYRAIYRLIKGYHLPDVVR
jgi:branched-chain amino acid transport system permease protein